MGAVGNLERFMAAQERAGAYARAIAELRAGSKRTHWMWFVFPQIAGLGRSEMARLYAIGSPEEAHAYAEHPILGARLRECADALLELPADLGATKILGPIDAMKLRSSMTLFERAVPDEPLFGRVLERWFAGARDERTLQLLGVG